MDLALNHNFEINGINLANYYIEKRSYDSVLYVHKRFLDEGKEKPKKLKKDKKTKKEKKIKEKISNKVDKGQQFDGDILNNEDANKIRVNNESVLEQTIQFAKNIAPLVLPPGRERSPSPVYYTVTASKKYRKKTPKPDNNEQQNVTYKKERSKKIVERFKNEKTGEKESLSVKETVSFSSNTLDDIQINQSLCCSFSDISEKKNKRRIDKKYKQNDPHKFVASESFEALASELLNTGDTKIKVHLMNEADKNILAENIRTPILNAIKECVSELKTVSELSTELESVKKYVKINTEKADNIMDKLACIEIRLDDHINNCAKAVKSKPKTPSPRVQKQKLSTLEQLSEDIIQPLSEESDNDEQIIISARKKARSKSAVIRLTPRQKERETKTACGEAKSKCLSVSAQLGVKPDRPNIIPARFCWNDAGRKNDS